MIALVHLVWGPLGPAPVRRFVASYLRHPAGAEHELVLLLNGVEPAGPRRAALIEALAGLPGRTIELPDAVLDLAAYAQGAQRLEHERLCLVNSHSEVLADGWLGHLASAHDQPGVGLAGASGSWASMLSYALMHAGLPSAYRTVYPDRRATAAAFAALEQDRGDGAPAGSSLRRRINTAAALTDMAIGFPRFPNHHVRTTAFVIDRQTLIAATPQKMPRKVHSHRLESGRRSLTRRIHDRGLRSVVVDRHGKAFDPPDWPASETFWQGAQRGLLVADNQSRAYEAGGSERRALLARYAWGAKAAPQS